MSYGLNGFTMDDGEEPAEIGLVIDTARTRVLHWDEGTLVRARVPLQWNGAIVCAFDSAQLPRKLADPGFGEMFLLGEGFAVCAFRCTKNTWYDWVDEMVLAAVNGWLAEHGASERIGYGSSMGGYGAIAFSGALGLDRVVAMSPQASVHAPFETRYSHFIPAMTRHMPIEARHVGANTRFDIYYDPMTPKDAQQTELLRRAIGDDRAFVPLRYASHLTADALSQAGLLKRATRMRVLHAAWREGRARSATYLSTLAMACRRRGHLRWALRLLNRAVRLEPREGVHYWRRGAVLQKMGDRRQALIQGEIAAAINPEHPRIILFLARILPPVQDRRADALIERALAMRPHSQEIAGIAASAREARAERRQLAQQQ